MSPTRKQEEPGDENRNSEPTDEPALAQENWDDLAGDVRVREGVPQGGDLYEPVDQAKPDDLPEEDDDNPFQDSDEALPDDEEEAAIARDPSKEKSRFDEV